MIPLHQLLSRFKGLTNTEKIKKEEISKLLLLNGIPVKVREITFQKKILFIKTSPIIKTEIFLKKNEILEQINKNLGDDNFLEIQ